MSKSRPGAVNLSVHRNTRAQREVQRVRSNLKSEAVSMARSKGLAGFAIVAWDKDWNQQVAWHSGDTIPNNVMPEFVKCALMREICTGDVRDMLNPEPDDGA